jgi:preprotein translocase subunit SecD
MKSNTTTKIILITAVLAAALYWLYPTYKFSSLSESEKQHMEIDNQKEFLDLKSKSLNLGLDLQGGMHVVLEVDIKELLNKMAKNKNEHFTEALNETQEQVDKSDEDFITIFNQKLQAKNIKISRYYSSVEYRTDSEVISYLREQAEEAVQRSKEILTNRVDEFGVSEPIIQLKGDRRIIVELAGVDNPTRVRELIGKTALLEFKLLKNDMVTQQVAENIQRYIQSKNSALPVDTSTLGASDSEADSDTAGTTQLEELFGVDTFAQAVEEPAAKADSSLSVFEENLFFLDPRDKQTLIVPTEKELKVKKLLELEAIKDIVRKDAGNGEFLWSSKTALDGQYKQLYLVNRHVELTGSVISDAFPKPGSSNDPTSIGKFEVSLTLNDEGAKKFARITGANIGKRLAIILDNKVFLAPTLQTKITGGRARITGLETMEEAKDIGIVLKAGALPAPVEIMEERTVGPSLGRDSIESGQYSTVMGLVLVMIFMIIYYKLSGSIADLALILNIVLIMSIMAYFHATLTLPGIAGIILTIGMAVDANVLIFERIREEIRRGKTVRSAVEVGYGKAFITILDANVTTFIAGMVLYTFGTGPIQGFALTLMIGIVSSMFTAIVVTRVIFDFTLEKSAVKKLSI